MSGSETDSQPKRGDGPVRRSIAMAVSLILVAGATPLLARLRRSPTYTDDISSEPDEAQRPRPETMAAFMEELDSHYGGAARWLAGHGFGRDDLQLLRAKLLRP